MTPHTPTKLPEPYYQTELGTLYCGDCLEIMPHLEKVDLVLTDPPYGVSFGGKQTKHTPRDNSGYLTGDSVTVGIEAIKLASTLFEKMIVFTGIRLMFEYPKPNDVACVYCPSGAGVGPWGFVNFHPFLLYGKRGGIGSRSLSFMSFHTSEKCGHPCPKPVEWMLWCIKLPHKAESILDPFLGSGTTAIACERLNRRWIGIEISEEYCEMAKQRLEKEVRQGKLFPVSKPEPPKQENLF